MWRPIIAVISLVFVLFVGACATTSDIRETEERLDSMEHKIDGLKDKLAQHESDILDINQTLAKTIGRVEKLEYLANNKFIVKEDYSKDKQNFDTVLQELKDSILKLQQRIDNFISYSLKTLNKLEKARTSPTSTKGKASGKLKQFNFKTKSGIDKAYKYARKSSCDKALPIYDKLKNVKILWYKERAYYFSSLCLYNMKKYDSAVLKFQEFLDKFPKSKLVSLALYYQALSLYKSGKKDYAKVVFKELISKYPKTTEAKKAKKYISVK